MLNLLYTLIVTDAHKRAHGSDNLNTFRATLVLDPSPLVRHSNTQNKFLITTTTTTTTTRRHQLLLNTTGIVNGKNEPDETDLAKDLLKKRRAKGRRLCS